MLRKSVECRIIEASIRWYNIGVEDGRKWGAPDQNNGEVIEIDEDGNFKPKSKVNILRDPEGEYALSPLQKGE